MSPSCSSSLPGALSHWLWQHSLSCPHPSSFPRLPAGLPILILPHLPLYTTDRGTSGSELSFHLPVTQTEPLWLSVYHSRRCDTRKYMTSGFYVCVCVCACTAVTLRGVITQVIFSGAPELPRLKSIFFLACPERVGAQFTELIVQNKSLCLPLHLSQIGNTSGLSGQPLEELNWTHSVWIYFFCGCHSVCVCVCAPILILSVVLVLFCFKMCWWIRNRVTAMSSPTVKWGMLWAWK